MERWLDLHARRAPSAAALALAPIPRFPGVGAFPRILILSRKCPSSNKPSAGLPERLPQPDAAWRAARRLGRRTARLPQRLERGTGVYLHWSCTRQESYSSAILSVAALASGSSS
jgi:hypothetical protein